MTPVSGPVGEWLARRLDRSRPGGLALTEALVAAVCAAGFVWMAANLPATSPTFAVDTWIVDALRRVASPWLARAMWLVTLAGNVLVATVHTVLAAVVLAVRGRWRRGVVLALSMAAATGTSEALKSVFERPRPPAWGALIAMPSGASFPSGHALATLVLYVGFALLIGLDHPGARARVAAVSVALAAAAAVGVSRVYLGVHWPSDVLASWLLGVPIISVATWSAVAWEGGGTAGAGLTARRALTAGAATVAVAVLALEMWRAPLA